MAIRKKGRSLIEVNGRSFAWWVFRDQEVRIASVDKRFVVAYRWIDDPLLTVSGPEFPCVPPSESRPVFLIPPVFEYQSPAGLARQVIQWALGSGDHPLRQVTDQPGS